MSLGGIKSSCSSGLIIRLPLGINQNFCLLWECILTNINGIGPSRLCALITQPRDIRLDMYGC